MYTDDTILLRGKHKFTRLSNVPAGYLLAIWMRKDDSDKELLEYIQNNLEKIQAREKDTVPASTEFGLKVFGGNIMRMTCHKTNKIIFPTAADAKAELKRIRESRTGNGYKPVRFYECPHCSGYHHTSRAYSKHYSHDKAK